MAEDKTTWGSERLETVYADPELGEVDAAELGQRLVEWAAALVRVGGALQVGAHRQRLDGPREEYVTTAVVLSWNSYVPPGSRVQVKAAPEAVLDGEPDEVSEPVTAA